MEPDNGVARFRRDLWKRAASTSIALVSLAVLAAPASAYDVSAEVKLYDTLHHQVGKVRLTEQGDGNVAVNVSVRDLNLTPNFHPGFHGFHVHAVGNCTIEDPSTPTPFSLAGGHFSSIGQTHGAHAGDFPVLLVRSDGTANVNFSTDRFTLDELFDDDGSAIIIHEGRDNYANIPDRYTVDGVSGPDLATQGTGDSGLRVACGVVEKVVRRDKGGKGDRGDRGDREDDNRHDR
jgi:Cu-Zn family superoxide dismutase